MTKRSLIPVVLLAVLTFTMQTAFSQQTVQKVFNEGVRLYNQQKFEEALTNFERILQVKSNHVYARNYATKCKTAIAAGAGPKNDLEGQLAKIIIPQINLTDAPIGDVLDYLTARAEELTEGKLVPNFIYKGTPEQRKNTLVSLNMRGVPMNQALKYVAQLSRTRVRYEEHAIVIDPNGTAPAENILKDAQSKQPANSTDPFGQQQTGKTVFD